jgi:hypothetical protein
MRLKSQSKTRTGKLQLAVGEKREQVTFLVTIFQVLECGCQTARLDFGLQVTDNMKNYDRYVNCPWNKVSST